MPIPRPDLYQHANANNAIVDSDGVRGGRRVVADLTALYALTTKADQLKQNVSIVRVLNPGDNKPADYLLINAASIGSAAGWEKRDIAVDAALSDTSTNPVQNKVIKAKFDSLGVVEPPATPSGASLVRAPYLGVSGTTVFADDPGAQVNWNGTVVTYNYGEIATNAPLPASGNRRIDYIYVTEGNLNLQIRYGNEGATPVAPSLLATEFYLSEAHWNSAGGSLDPAAHTHELATVEKAGFMSSDHVASLFAKADNQQTANQWSWIGLASSIAKITIKGWLDFLTNKVKLIEENKLDKAAVVQTLGTSTTQVPSVKLLNDTFAPFANQVAISGMNYFDRLRNNAGTEGVFQASHVASFYHNGKLLVQQSASIHIFDETTLNRLSNFTHSHGSISSGFFVLIEGTSNVLFCGGSRISEISTVTNTLVRTVSHNGVMTRIEGAAQISPTEIFVTDAGNNLIYRVDIATLAIVSSVAMVGSSTNGYGGAVSTNKTYYSYSNSISASVYIIHIPTMTTISISSRGRGGMHWYTDNILYNNGSNGYQKDIINSDNSVTSDLIAGSPFAVQYGIPLRLSSSLIFLLSNSHKALVFNMATDRYIMNQEIITGGVHSYSQSNAYLANRNLFFLASVSNVIPSVYHPINFTIS